MLKFERRGTNTLVQWLAPSQKPEVGEWYIRLIDKGQFAVQPNRIIYSWDKSAYVRTFDSYAEAVKFAEDSEKKLTQVLFKDIKIGEFFQLDDDDCVWIKILDKDRAVDVNDGMAGLFEPYQPVTRVTVKWEVVK